MIIQACRSLLKSLAIALLLFWPLVGWPSTTVSDRPLFINASVDHNLIFVVDDSGSMDFEVLAPAVGNVSAVDDGYMFDPGGSGTYTDGKRVLSADLYSLSKRQYDYLHSSEYNLQYYDPEATYKPWPSTDIRIYSDAEITKARLDPGFDDPEKADLTATNKLGVGSGYIPATFFVKKAAGTVDYTAKRCPYGYRPWSDTRCRKWNSWWGWGNGYRYYQSSSTNQVDCATPNKSNYPFSDGRDYVEYSHANSIAPDGACLQRIELVAGNESAVQEATGQSLAVQQQNFANWFEYYRRRHQVIRGAIADSVKDLENMRLGVDWIHSRRDMTGKLYNSSKTTAGESTGLNSFLNDHYSGFDDGNWSGGGTPNRLGLQNAGIQFANEDVRGELACRNNFALLFTDGYANNHSTGSIDADNADEDASAPFGNGTYQDTLGDIAYYYYENLIDSDGNEVSGGAMRVDSDCGTPEQKPWMDCNTEFHMNTYTVALGMEGENYAGKTHFNVMDAHTNNPDWSKSSMNSSGNAAQIDDLYHAAVNGKGEYYDAKSTTELVDSLKAAVNKIKKELGSGSNVSFNTGSLKEGGMIYSAQFTSQVWTGTLRGEKLGTDGQVTSRVWDAADILDARDFSTDPRLVLTYGLAASGDMNGTEFTWDSLSAAQQADLKYGGNDDDLGKKRLQYIRGEAIAGYDTELFRERDSILGPIINSSPAFVGIPPQNLPNVDPFGVDGNRYSSFRSSNKDRQPMVYVGANDGMFHGFNADSGVEVMAYIPSFSFSDQPGEGLHALTDPNYDYRSYVDLPVNVSDVFIDSEWKTIAVSGSRGSYPGIFALDVTDPDAFSVGEAEKTVLWEFTKADDSRLGHLTSAVQIAMLEWGDNDYRWSAVFNNGYGTSSNGLFVLDLSKPTTEAWSESANYRFIELSSGSGLSPVRLVDYEDQNGNSVSDGITDRAYAGDLDGRLWAIDLTDEESSWGSAFGSDPLFTAKGPSGKPQPITAQPVVARNTYEDSLSAPNLIVLFGTGKYLEAADVNTDQVQSFYGISDRASKNIQRSSLVDRKLTGDTFTDTVSSEKIEVRKTSSGELDWKDKYGWYVDFDLKSGERVVTGGQVKGKYVVLPTNIPATGDPCGGGGSSFLMALEIDGSTDPSKSIIDVNNDGKLSDTDKGWAGAGYSDGIINNISIIGDIVIGSDSNAKKPTFLTDLGSNANRTGRIGWREILPD